MDIYDRLEMLEDAIGSIESAIETMRPSEMDDDISDMLDDLSIVLRHRKEEVRSDIEARENAEREQEIRDYYKEVI